MTIKLADLFMDARAASIEYEGELVHSMYTIAGVAPGSVLQIRFEQVTDERPQAVRLAIAKDSGGMLEVEGLRGDDVVLWSDTSPELTSMRIVSDAPASLDIWNMHRDTKGREQAWCGNAGMRVSKRGTTFWFGCSDAFGDANFDDLVVSISVDVSIDTDVRHLG